MNDACIDEKYIQDTKRHTRRKKEHGIPKCIREDNIEMDVKDVRCEMWAGFMWLGIRSSRCLLGS
jgi:hypothetical protein